MCPWCAQHGDVDAETQLALEKGQKNVDLDTGEVLQD
eukprot:COSAG01_NODE_30669_length_611_cov_2.082031_1_plen_36_part_01